MNVIRKKCINSPEGLKMALFLRFFCIYSQRNIKFSVLAVRRALSGRDYPMQLVFELLHGMATAAAAHAAKPSENSPKSSHWPIHH